MQNNPKTDDNDIHDFANAVLPPSKDQEVVYKKKTNFGIKGNIKWLVKKFEKKNFLGIWKNDTVTDIDFSLWFS